MLLLHYILTAVVYCTKWICGICIVMYYMVLKKEKRKQLASELFCAQCQRGKSVKDVMTDITGYSLGLYEYICPNAQDL